MLIQKGGISRNIDPNKVQKYKDKGYVEVEKSIKKPAASPKTAPKK